MLKNFLFVFIVAISFNCLGQTSIGHKWQIGIGGGLVKFSDEDVAFIGDKHLSQIPRFNVTRIINNKISVDAALSFGSFDSETNFITTNNVSYFSFDVSGRYRLMKNASKLDPFVFVGGSLVDSVRKMTPTINIGAGATCWFSKKLGLSTNMYYKHSSDSFESMRSHLQFTLGVVFGTNIGKGRRGGNGSTGCYYDLYKK